MKKITRPIKLALTVEEAARLLRAIDLVIAIEDLKPPYHIEFTVAKLQIMLRTQIQKYDTP